MITSRLQELRNDIPIVLGAGALLDLLGTGRALDILTACSQRFFAEANIGLRLPKGFSASDDFRALQSRGIIHLKALPPESLGILVALAGAIPPDDLSDEEAACVSLAYGIKGAAVLVDAKSLRVAASILEAGILHSLDLLSESAVQDALGVDDLREAVIRARRKVKLRIPSRFNAWAAPFLAHLTNRTSLTAERS